MEEGAKHAAFLPGSRYASGESERNFLGQAASVNTVEIAGGTGCRDHPHALLAYQLPVNANND